MTLVESSFGCVIVIVIDASYRNNEDGSSQRGMTVFLEEFVTYGSLVRYASQKMNRTVLTTTVAELFSFMQCFGVCQFRRGFWVDISGEVAEIHLRTDAKNLVTTARTTHLPERKETISNDFHVARGSLFRKCS